MQGEFGEIDLLSFLVECPLILSVLQKSPKS